MSIKTRIETPVVSGDCIPTCANPWLCQHRGFKYIVLFTDVTIGTVVHAGDCKFKVGHYSNNWSEADDSKTWVRLPVGTRVILEV